MGKHNETGAKGELIAREYLTSKGYILLHHNWRSSHKEIDIVALDGETLVFVEIKTRRGLEYGFPEEAVTRLKQENLRKAASDFMDAHPQYPTMRFDVLSILLMKNSTEEIIHLVDAF